MDICWLKFYTDADWAGSITDGRSTFGYCTFVGGNLVLAKQETECCSKKYAEAEFRATALGICEIMWFRGLLEDLKIHIPSLLKLYCDNKSVIAIARNPILHDRTEHVEIDEHFIKEKIDSGQICMLYLPTAGQVAEIFTKGLTKKQFEKLICKLVMEDIFRPA
ncbi:hypothetical protein ACOSQ3_012884 [Xanthoceras sorbifolium]